MSTVFARRSGKTRTFGAQAGVLINQCEPVFYSPTGYVCALRDCVSSDRSAGEGSGSTQAYFIFIGLSIHAADNQEEGDGESQVAVERGEFFFHQDGSIDVTHINQDVYFTQNHILTRTAEPTSPLLMAGAVVQVDHDGVWIKSRI